MGLIILNVGAGLLPLVASDFEGIDKVINFDPLDSFRHQEFAMAMLFKHIVNSSNDIIYGHAESQVDAICDDGDVDCVFSVSPFGFPVVNSWVHRKLAVGGFVFIAGSEKNKWVKPQKLFEGDLRNRYRPALLEEKYHLFKASRKIEVEYTSYTSAAEKKTDFEYKVAYKKLIA